MSEKYVLTSLIWEEDGAYVSRCSELGVSSFGSTPEEAIDNLKEAVILYIENAVELGIMEDIRPALISPHKFTSSLEITA